MECQHPVILTLDVFFFKRKRIASPRKEIIDHVVVMRARRVPGLSGSHDEHRRLVEAEVHHHSHSRYPERVEAPSVRQPGHVEGRGIAGRREGAAVNTAVPDRSVVRNRSPYIFLERAHGVRYCKNCTALWFMRQVRRRDELHISGNIQTPHPPLYMGSRDRGSHTDMVPARIHATGSVMNERRSFACSRVVRCGDKFGASDFTVGNL